RTMVRAHHHTDPAHAPLRATLLRHHLAKPAQQHARTAERATHDVIPRTADAAGTPTPALRNQAEECPQGPRPTAASHPWPIANATCKLQANEGGGAGQIVGNRAVFCFLALPGITGGYPPAGHAELVAVDDCDIDGGQPGG